MSRLKEQYRSVIVKQLLEAYSYSNVMQVPKLVKITLNMGVGEAANDKKILTAAIEDLTLIAGQKAIQTFAKKSIAGFKIRAGWPIGCKVTLRDERMYEFLERLIYIAIPRIRDFRGFNPRAFDGRGNYNLGIGEQIVFPEINFDKVDKVRGLDISITTTAHTDEEGIALLRAFGFPLREQKKAT